MKQTFNQLLEVGGRSNSLGEVDAVVKATLNDRNRLSELYECLLSKDAWVRMRAADAIEKVCRVHPDWLESYIDKFIIELSSSNQPSIQWHLAQIYTQVNLSTRQIDSVTAWLKRMLRTTDLDWIVASECMKALVYFMKQGFLDQKDIRPLLKMQQQHKSKSVVKKASLLLSEP